MKSPLSVFERAPFVVFWELTRACDLVCRHCRAHAIPRRDPLELDTDEGKRLLEDVRRMGGPLVVLTGGDPAKRPDLLELVRHGHDLGLRMALTPSATPLITSSLLTELRDAGLSRLALSLDGATRETHDRFRGAPGSYQRTLSILATARELGLSTQVNTSVGRFNVAELAPIAGLASELGVAMWAVFFIVPTGRAQDMESLDAEETERVLHRVADLGANAPFDVKSTAAPHLRRVLLQRKQKRREIVGLGDGIGRAPRGVTDGQGVAFVSHRGDVYPSGFLPLRCGNVRDSGLAAIYRLHPLFRALRDGDRLGGKCGVCEFRRVCGGSRARAYAETGDPLAADPSCAYAPRSWSQASQASEAQG